MFMARFANSYLTTSPNRWGLVKAVLQSAVEPGISTNAAGSLHVGRLLLQAAVTFFMEPKFRTNYHPLEVVLQMERLISV